MKLYSIKPLEWTKIVPTRYQAPNPLAPFMMYAVYESSSGVWTLYNGEELYYDFNSLDEAKAKAQEDWQERLSQYLTEYKEEK